MPIAIRETVEPVQPRLGRRWYGVRLDLSSSNRRPTGCSSRRRSATSAAWCAAAPFSIAGHRGLGKDHPDSPRLPGVLRQVPPSEDRRVLPVFLHGPNLRPDITERSPWAGRNAEKGEEEADPDENAEEPPQGGDAPDGEAREPGAGEPTRRVAGVLSEDETENALIQITLELAAPWHGR